MRIPFVDSDIEDLVMLEGDEIEVRSINDIPEIQVDSDDDEEIDSSEFGVSTEDIIFPDDSCDNINTVTSAPKMAASRVPLVDSSKKLGKKPRFVLAFLVWILSMELAGLMMNSNFKVFVPKYSAAVVPEFNVEMGFVHPIQFTPIKDPSGATVEYNVTSGWKINFGVKNPSDEHILSHSNVVATVHYKRDPIWCASVRDFYLAEREEGKDGEFFLHAVFNPGPIQVSNTFAISMLDDINSRSSLDFSVDLDGVVQQKKTRNVDILPEGELIWDAPKSLKVLCELDVEFLTKGLLMAAVKPKECKAKVGGWFGLW